MEWRSSSLIIFFPWRHPGKEDEELRRTYLPKIPGENQQRLPEAERMLFGKSREAVQRRSAAFGRIVEVDDRLASHEFADCDYCEEGWFGTTQSPPGGCCATYEKMNFILAPKEWWLHPLFCQASKPTSSSAAPSA